MEGLECNNSLPDRSREIIPNLGIKLRCMIGTVILTEIIIFVASCADKSMLKPHINLIEKQLARTTEDYNCQDFGSVALSEIYQHVYRYSVLE